jgi:hypothetical protein
MRPSTTVLVEGLSDRLALERLAVRLGYDLAACRVRVLDVGGVTNFHRVLERHDPGAADVRLAGLCDYAEREVVQRALEAAGFGTGLTVQAMESLGFFVCDGDLEDELLRAVGVGPTLTIIEANGDLPRFRRTQRQLPYRRASLERQVRHIMTQKKIQYAEPLVDALDLARVPRSLRALLEFVVS